MADTKIKDLSKEQVMFFEHLLEHNPAGFEVDINMINNFYDASKERWVFNMVWIIDRLEQMWVIENLEVKHLWTIDSYVYGKLHDRFSYIIKDISLMKYILQYFFDTNTNQDFIKETQKLAKAISSELLLEQNTWINISKIKPFLNQMGISHHDEEVLEFNLALLSYRSEDLKDIVKQLINKLSQDNYGVFLSRFDMVWYLEKFCHVNRTDILPLLKGINPFYSHNGIQFNAYWIVWKNNFILFSDIPKVWKYKIFHWRTEINLHNPRTAICLLYYFLYSDENLYDNTQSDILIINQFRKNVWWHVRKNYKEINEYAINRYYNQVRRLIKYLS